MEMAGQDCVELNNHVKAARSPLGLRHQRSIDVESRSERRLRKTSLLTRGSEFRDEVLVFVRMWKGMH
jgi:hypothetical protein